LRSVTVDPTSDTIPEPSTPRPTFPIIPIDIRISYAGRGEL
jgi:hypothetical protein